MCPWGPGLGEEDRGSGRAERAVSCDQTQRWSRLTHGLFWRYSQVPGPPAAWERGLTSSIRGADTEGHTDSTQAAREPMLHKGSSVHEGTGSTTPSALKLMLWRVPLSGSFNHPKPPAESEEPGLQALRQALNLLKPAFRLSTQN